MNKRERRVLDMLASEGQHFGFDISKTAKVRAGYVYWVLVRFERRGLVFPRWGYDDNNHQRRVYELTTAGHEVHQLEMKLDDYR